MVPHGRFSSDFSFDPPPPKKKKKKQLSNETTGVNSSFGHIFECSCILLLIYSIFFDLAHSRPKVRPQKHRWKGEDPTPEGRVQLPRICVRRRLRWGSNSVSSFYMSKVFGSYYAVLTSVFCYMSEEFGYLADFRMLFSPIELRFFLWSY